MRRIGGLRDEHHLVGAEPLVLQQDFADLFGRADAVRRPHALADHLRAAAPDLLPEVLLIRLEVVPQIGLARLMLAEDIVMGDRVTEEPMRLVGDLAGAIAVLQTHEIDGKYYVRIYRRADRYAFLLQRLVVSLDPWIDLVERDESEGE